MYTVDGVQSKTSVKLRNSAGRNSNGGARNYIVLPTARQSPEKFNIYRSRLLIAAGIIVEDTTIPRF
jgi:hypothetical protein